MTTSTDKVNEKSKKAKVKGPIRTEAVVPAVILSVLIGAYFTLFFDGHLRRAIEYVGTQVNGAEVNVGYLNTSFLRAEIKFGDIQVTDKEKPHRNIVQIGKIHFKMLWDALLRAKVVVDEASILDIQALVPRKTPGYVVPPPPPEKGPSAIERVQSEVLNQTQKKFNKNFLGDVAGMLGGTDPKDVLKNIEGQLKSDARIKELEKELKEKQVTWEKRLKEMPQGKELKDYESRIKALKFDINDPKQFAQSTKEAEKIVKEIDQKVKLVEQTSKEVGSDVDNYSKAYKDLEKMVQEDINDLQKRLKLPSIDSKEFSQQLFMGMIERRLVGIRKYVEVARKYMPPKKTAAEKQAEAQEKIVPPERGEGVNFKFPITVGYPLFWLKHAAISSELGTSEYGGNIKGELKDVTTDPSFIGRPTIATARGDFPKQNIFDFDAKLTLDHTKEQAKDSLMVQVGRFPVTETQLSESPDVGLAIAQARGQSLINAVLVDETLNIEMKNNFSDIKYDLKAKQKMVQEIIGAILNGIPVVTLNAGITGSLTSFDVHINSNLGEELAKGFQKQLQAKIAEAQAKLKAFVDEKIGKEKQKLKAEMDKLTSQIQKELDSKKAEVDKTLKDAKSQATGGKAPGKKLEEEGKKLLKKFF